jgi:Tol biopolymer transport system component/C-terminal processing protease CtpA/Prc
MKRLLKSVLRSACGFAVSLAVLSTPGMAPELDAQDARPSLYQPTVSPDGSEIAFVSGGDIWTVLSTGGAARILVAHAADESAPLYSPDGTRLAFVSNRAGDNDIYVMDLTFGTVMRLTYGDGNEELDAWSPDGEMILFADGRHDPGGQPDIWSIQSSGGTPVKVLADEYSPEFHAAISPDGSTIAIAANARMAQSQWWRNGHSHIDEAEIWLVTSGDRPTYRQLSASGSKSVQPMWTRDGDDVVYVSDRSGTENLWTQSTAGGEARALTTFTDGRLLFPRISADTDLVVFERDFEIWSMQLPGGTPTPVDIELMGAVQTPIPEELSLNRGFGDLSLSPDGEKVAFTARGEVFAVSIEDGGQATRVTRSVAAESEITWAPDSRRIAYVSRRDGVPSLFLYDFGSNTETRLTDADGVDITPRFSPDGDAVAYARDGRQIRVHDLESGDDRLVAEGQLWVYPFSLSEPLVWSPDGEWLAWLSTDARMFSNVWLAPAMGGEARRASELANSSAGSIAWAPNGETLYFDTQHRTQVGQVAAVDLVPRAPLFREDRFAELFEEEDEDPTGDEGSDGAGVNEPVTPNFDGIRRRLTLLPIGVDVGTMTLSPDGKTLVFNAAAEGQQNLYVYSVDPEDDGPRVTRQLTSTAGSKSRPLFMPDGREVVYLASGRIQIANVESGQTRGLSVTAQLEADFDALKVEGFDQGWTYMRDHFYDPDLHGADWNAVRASFAPQIAGAATRAEYSRLMNMMLGELNGSHLGHSYNDDRSGSSTGVLGLRFDAAQYTGNGRLVVTEVVPLGPAHIEGSIESGEILVSVDGISVDGATNLDALLQDTQGDKVILTMEASDGSTRNVEVRPTSLGAERQLEYRDWVETKRAYVAVQSGGRLGYVHMPSMSAGSLDQLYVDLDADNHDKDGVVVDIRSNNGGFVNAYALDVFARRGYITMETRGFPQANARSMLGQRSLELGTALVVNQHTLSDGEDFTEGYRTLGLGQVVGEPTAGWIIFTWSASLVDGTNLRMPRSRIRGVAGDDMELYPRDVDVEVVRPMGESYTGRDSQLDAAIRVLLEGR